jgi:UTP:GlnB (protein PII) uridylyltransferase
VAGRSNVSVWSIYAAQIAVRGRFFWHQFHQLSGTQLALCMDQFARRVIAQFVHDRLRAMRILEVIARGRGGFQPVRDVDLRLLAKNRGQQALQSSRNEVRHVAGDLVNECGLTISEQTAVKMLH